MPNVWLVSDTHFGHWGVCKFLREDGTKLRPWDNPFKMDEDMVELWNDTVKPNDKLYHLGDAVINRRALHTLGRLNGDKVLIKGNHDIFKLEDYVPYFRDVRGYHVMDKCILSHIPVHPSQKGRFKANIHGHLHSNLVDDALCGGKDPWYINVCVEQTNFKPIAWDVVKERIDEYISNH